MATFVSKDGKHTISTDNARERVNLLSQGYKQQAQKAAEKPAAPKPQAGKPQSGS